MIVKKVVKGVCAAALLAFAACSASDAQQEGEAPEPLGSIEEQIGVSCGSVPASTGWDGGIDNPYTSTRTYGDCYRGKIIEIRDYASEYAVGGYTEVAWGDDPPSTTDCAGSTLGAHLFELRGSEWVHIISKGASGDMITDDIPSDMVGPVPQPPPRKAKAKAKASADVAAALVKASDVLKPGDVAPPSKAPPACRIPRVYFDERDMQAGKTYKIAAGARLPGPIMRKVTFSSTKGSCGQSNDQCCWSGSECAVDNFCANKTCTPCGGANEACCPESLGRFVCDHSGLRCMNDECTPCGGPGQACCGDKSCATDTRCGPKTDTCDACGGIGEQCCAKNGVESCDANAQCTSGKCVAKPVPPSCGSIGAACCKDKSGSYCGPDADCRGGTCVEKPTTTCGGLGGVCCAGGTCNSPLACQNTITGLRCIGLDGECNSPGDPCCSTSQAGSFTCQSSGYFPYIKCNTTTLTCE